MSRITKVASIKASPEKVLDYIADVKNHPAFISALKSIDNLQGDAKKTGESWQWTYIMSGVEISGKAETVKYEQNKVYSYKTTSGIESTFTYSVEPEDAGTRLTIDVEYMVPETVLGKIIDKTVVERLNDQEATQASENLKAILE